MGGTERFPRQTFLEVLDAQQNIRKTLKEWAEEDKVVTDDEEELEFRKDFSKATAGLCYNIPFNKIHPAWQPMSLSKVITMMLTCDNENVAVGSSNETTYEKKKYKIGNIWEKILERLNETVFDQALNLAIKISPERREKTGKTHSGPRG